MYSGEKNGLGEKNSALGPSVREIWRFKVIILLRAFCVVQYLGASHKILQFSEKIAFSVKKLCFQLKNYTIQCLKFFLESEQKNFTVQ